mmetsp:Transcript_43524/g.130540  ORF Transcript_43524/g.130540 Transcript_43524/m.130540 type:complete len:250 (+) Transcript_43524:640-1389(+)
MDGCTAAPPLTLSPRACRAAALISASAKFREDGWDTILPCGVACCCCSAGGAAGMPAAAAAVSAWCSAPPATLQVGAWAAHRFSAYFRRMKRSRAMPSSRSGRSSGASRASHTALALALPTAAILSTCSGSQVSSVHERTALMWTPRPRWMPAHFMQMNTPRLTDAQLGRHAAEVAWQSAHLRFSGRSISSFSTVNCFLFASRVTPFASPAESVGLWYRLLPTFRPPVLRLTHSLPLPPPPLVEPHVIA